MESKEILGMMSAYSSIYEKKEEPEMEEGEKEESEKDEGGKHKEGKHPKGKEEPGEKVTEKEGKEKEEKEMKESADLFDYILEHLVAEGYADTNKAALAIMANMSEEWKQSIVEGMFDFLPKSKGVITPPDKRNALQKYSDATKPAFSALPKSTTVVPAKQARSREFTNPPS